MQVYKQKARSNLLSFLKRNQSLNADLTDDEVMEIALSAQEGVRSKKTKPDHPL